VALGLMMAAAMAVPARSLWPTAWTRRIDWMVEARAS
jgi:hypothetical protein